MNAASPELNTIDSFSGRHRWLSNFWPCLVPLGQFMYPSVENAYQAQKFPESEREAFTRYAPGYAKKIATHRTLPEDWDTKKHSIMAQLIRRKFHFGSELAGLLIATDNAILVEGNTWGDTYWGVCDGDGENQLGHILMGHREHLINESKL